MSFIIDPSVALAWVLPDETNADAARIRGEIEAGAAAYVPQHWWLEVSNALLMAERRRRITAAQADQALGLLFALPIEEDELTADNIPGRTMSLARKHGLPVYDASYLELAQRRNAILATFDEQLLKAAQLENVALPKK